MLSYYKNILFQLERGARLITERVPAQNREVVLIASFPRSGNTWVRFILANMLQYMHDGPEVDFHTLPLYMPDPPYGGEKGRYAPVDGPLFLKTHYPYIPQYNPCKSILIVRKPENALDSLYRYLDGEHGIEYESARKFLQNWRSGATAWKCFHMSWSSRATVIVRYEDLMHNPFDTLKKALTATGVFTSDAALTYGVKMSTRERMALLREERGDPYANREGFAFVRTSNFHKNKVFNESDLSYIEKECGRVANKCGY